MRQSDEDYLRKDKDVFEVNSAYNVQGQNEELVVERYKDLSRAYTDPFVAQADQFKLWKEFCDMLTQEKVDGKWMPKPIDIKQLLDIITVVQFPKKTKAMYSMSGQGLWRSWLKQAVDQTSDEYKASKKWIMLFLYYRVFMKQDTVTRDAMFAVLEHAKKFTIANTMYFWMTNVFRYEPTPEPSVTQELNQHIKDDEHVTVTDEIQKVRDKINGKYAEVWTYPEEAEFTSEL